MSGKCNWRSGVLLAAAIFLAVSGCSAIDDGLVGGTRRFVSEGFGFEVSLTDSLDRAGWFIIRERDAALTHVYMPPDSSQWTGVAVVIPPSASYPALAPINVDVFQMTDPSATSADIAALRLAQVTADSSLISHRSLTVDGQNAEELRYAQTTGVVYETFFARNGLGYAINALGASDTLAVPRPFTIDSRVYTAVVASFRFTN